MSAAHSYGSAGCLLLVVLSLPLLCTPTAAGFTVYAPTPVSAGVHAVTRTVLVCMVLSFLRINSTSAVYAATCWCCLGCCYGLRCY